MLAALLLMLALSVVNLTGVDPFVPFRPEAHASAAFCGTVRTKCIGSDRVPWDVVANKPVPKTNAERKHQLELAKLRYRAWLNIGDKIFKLVRQLIGAGAIVVCFYFVYLSVDAISGKTTSFSGLVSAVVDMKADRWVLGCLAAICGVGWRTERKLRRKTIADRADHIKELEERVAPERKTSGLRPDGRPTQRDLDA